MSNELLIVYNTCGINGEDYSRVDKYIESIDSILSQNFEHPINLCISSCLNSDRVVGLLQDYFFDHADICRIQEIVPVNVTFNKSVQECVKRYGEFDFYCYLDSGVRLIDPSTLQRMHDVAAQGNVMVSANPSTDSGFENWKIKYDNKIEYSIPLGSAINLHCQFFSNKIFRSFDNQIIPTLFRSYGTESVFGAICAALRSQWILLTNLMVEHRSLDGASACSAGGRHDEIFLLNKTIWDIFFTPEAKECGIFYEVWRNIVPLDRSKFDENGYAKDDKLKDWILNNLFLSESLLSYDKLKGEFWQKQ